MPIISPDIQKALRAVGLSKDPNDKPLPSRLEENNLGLDDALEQLSSIMQNGDPNQRLRAIDTTLKLHKVLNDQPNQIPQISIQITDRFGIESASSINPILVPRQPLIITKEKVQ